MNTIYNIKQPNNVFVFILKELIFVGSGYLLKEGHCDYVILSWIIYTGELYNIHLNGHLSWKIKWTEVFHSQFTLVIQPFFDISGNNRKAKMS